jgi:hypothetical protein
MFVKDYIQAFLRRPAIIIKYLEKIPSTAVKDCTFRKEYFKIFGKEI